MWALALLARLPGPVWAIAVLLGFGWFMQWSGTTPGEVGLFIGPKVTLPVETVLVNIKYVIAVTALLTVFWVVTHHQVYSILGAIGTGVLVLVAIAWNIPPLGAWITAHLTGAG